MVNTDLHIGDIITITAWDITGMVLGLERALYGPTGSVSALIQEDPESDELTRYHLAPGQYTIEA